MSGDDHDAFGRPLEEPAAPQRRKGRRPPDSPDFARAPLGSEWDVAGRATLRAIAVWEMGGEEERGRPGFVRAQLALAIFDTARGKREPFEWNCYWPQEDDPEDEPVGELTPMVAEDAADWRELAPDALRRWDGLWPEGAGEPKVTRPGGLRYDMETSSLTLVRLDGPLPEGLRDVRRMLDLEPQDLDSGAPVLDGAHLILCTGEGEPVASFVEHDVLWRPLPPRRRGQGLGPKLAGAVLAVAGVLWILDRA